MNIKTAFVSLIIGLSFLACSGPVRRSEIIPRPLPKKVANSLIKELSKHLGEPYRFGGTTPSGWDCSGFVSIMFDRAAKIELPRASYEMYATVSRIPLQYGRPGDLVFFNINSAKPSHVGIYLGNEEFIHVSCSEGVIKSSLLDKYYEKHFIGIGRIPVDKIALSK
jgi:cell wall-associated NlpC family hydrolase